MLLAVPRLVYASRLLAVVLGRARRPAGGVEELAAGRQAQGGGDTGREGHARVQVVRMEIGRHRAVRLV